MKITELDLARIIIEDNASNSRDPIRLPTNEELMQMIICPTKHNLQNVMKLGNRTVARTSRRRQIWGLILRIQIRS